jgi:hypothetical protein
MNKNTAKGLNSKNKYAIVYWDWKENTPVNDIVKLGRKYKNVFFTSIDDGNYAIFSNSKIKGHAQAERILWSELYGVE